MAQWIISSTEKLARQTFCEGVQAYYYGEQANMHKRCDTCRNINCKLSEYRQQTSHCYRLLFSTFIFLPFFSVLLPPFFTLRIQGVPGGKDLTSGECSLGQTIPI